MTWVDELISVVAPFVGVIIGAAITALAALTIALVANRAQDRRLRVQLFHDDSKKAIAELYRLVNERQQAAGVWIGNISTYLDSYEAKAFIPLEVRAWGKRPAPEVFGKNR